MRTGKKRLLLLGLAVLLGLSAYWLRGCIQVDRCLDHGGRWDYEQGACDL